MKTSRRGFIKGGVGAAALVASSAHTASTDPVFDEMQRRLRYMTPPDGTPPDILSQPSPPVDPFDTYALDQLRPPTARPLFNMNGTVSAAEAAATGATDGADISSLSDPVWLKLFNARFMTAADRLRDEGFLVPHTTMGQPLWTVRGDQVRYGRVRIDIGDVPDPDAHQRFFELRPRKFYIMREAEFLWEYHPQYGDACWTWGYHNIYYDPDTDMFRSSRPSSPGPVFHAIYGEPIMSRRINDLPEIGSTSGRANLSFALPSTTSHLHNAHTASESDGYPNDWLNPGEYWDHHYGNFPSGHDDREKLSTLWYHDHRMDFTASNVYAGLDGFYLLFDEQDADDEASGWNLPGGDYDIPLIFHDLLFAQEEQIRDGSGAVIGMRPRHFGRSESTRWTFESAQDWHPLNNANRGRVLANGARRAIRHVGFVDEGSATRYEPSPQVIFDGFNTDGILGDRWTVNRRIQPLLEVEPRKYRLRLLNGGPSRFYELFLHATGVAEANAEAVFASPSTVAESTAESTEVDHKFIVVCGDGNFQPNPVMVNSVYIGVAQRVDVIVDFAQFGPGATVYIVNQLEQENGRGPTERRVRKSDYASDEDFFKANALMAFRVKNAPVTDTSALPLLFRELPPIDFTEVARQRLWEFDYDGGLWTINGGIFDPNRIDAGIEQDTAEIWTFRNGGNGWHHPIHSHFTEFIILEMDDQPFLQGSIQTQLLPQGLGETLAADAPPAPPPPDAADAQAAQTDVPTEAPTEGVAPTEGAAAPAAEPEPVAPERSASGGRGGFVTPRSLREVFGPYVGAGAREAPTESLGLEAVPPTWEELADAIKQALAAYLADQGRDQTQIDAVLADFDALIAGLNDDAGRLALLQAIADLDFARIRFHKHADFERFADLMPLIGLGRPFVDRFVGGPRRDVALLLPNTEVTVFMRWKDFMGRHIMHCHNVVHEDHAMMIRWDIVPKGQGFDTPRHVDSIAQLGDQVEGHRREHIESHPARATGMPDDT